MEILYSRDLKLRRDSREECHLWVTKEKELTCTVLYEQSAR
jgi:hypothetical protein